MDIVKALFTEFLDFFRLGGLYDALASGQYASLKTINGLIAILTPLAPFVIFGEMAFLVFIDKTKRHAYKMNLLVIFANRVFGHLISFSVIFFCYGALSGYALCKVTWSWAWFLYAYLFYELGTFIYHYSAHKIRLLWCFHSIHHSASVLNASVTLRTFYVENLYTELIKTSVIALAGVPLTMYFLIMTIDSIWGAFVHVSETVLANGRLGILEKIILTPSHHRVHHGRNGLYIDTNYCAMINIWDRLFDTYQEEQVDTPIEFGLNRNVDIDSFRDVYFGELVLLWRDVKTTRGIVNKVKYMFMPPGWRPDTPCFTAKYIRKEFIDNLSEKRMQPTCDKMPG
jgi:sterol desaturase/sphingolipid hydroxylase (fatty acid hydroxylase superfamily)